MPGGVLGRLTPVPKFVPVPPVAVHQFTIAFVPVTLLAVSVVVAVEQMGFAAAVADTMPAALPTVTTVGAEVIVQPVAILVVVTA